MFKLRPYRRGHERSNLLAMATKEGTCGPDCQVITLEADDVNDEGVRFPDIIHGIIHAEKCASKDYYGNAFLDAVYRNEVSGVPDKVVRHARDMTARILVVEIVQAACSGQDYGPMIQELKPLIEDSPAIQTLLRNLIANLEIS